MTMKRFLPLLLCLWVGVAQTQSPWPRSKAGFYAQVSYLTIPNYANVFDDNGETGELFRAIGEHTIQLYGEYGLTKRTTLVAALPFRILRSGESTVLISPVASGSLNGFGNPSFAIRHNFSNGAMPFTATVRVDVPVDRFDGPTGLRTGYDALTVLPMLSTGKGYGRWYWFAYGGYGFRSNEFSHFLDAGAEVGIRLSNVWLMGFSELNTPLDNGSPSVPLTNLLTRMYVNNQGFLSIGLKAVVEMGRFWGFSASAAGAGWGRNVPARPALGIGAYFKWD